MEEGRWEGWGAESACADLNRQLWHSILSKSCQTVFSPWIWCFHVTGVFYETWNFLFELPKFISRTVISKCVQDFLNLMLPWHWRVVWNLEFLVSSVISSYLFRTSWYYIIDSIRFEHYLLFWVIFWKIKKIAIQDGQDPRWRMSMYYDVNAGAELFLLISCMEWWDGNP